MQGFSDLVEPFFTFSDAFQDFAIGDILEREQNALGFLAVTCYGASAKQHRSGTGSLQLDFNFEVIEKALSREQVMEQLSQLGDVPPFVGNLINRLSYGLGRRNPECFIESTI